MRTCSQVVTIRCVRRLLPDTYALTQELFPFDTEGKKPSLTLR